VPGTTVMYHWQCGGALKRGPPLTRRHQQTIRTGYAVARRFGSRDRALDGSLYYVDPGGRCRIGSTWLRSLRDGESVVGSSREQPRILTAECSSQRKQRYKQSCLADSIGPGLQILL
jgi:hypothetical protein